MKRLSVLILCSVCSGSITAQCYTLEQLKDSALQHNIAVRKARHGIDAAQQQRKEAFTKFFPNVSGTAVTFNANRGMAKMDMNIAESMPPSLGATLSLMLPQEALMELTGPMSISMMKNGTIASLTAMQPVFAGGQIINGNKLAKVGEEASRLQLQLSENEVEKTTEQYYWQLVSLQEKVTTLDAVDSLLAGIHKDVDVAVRAGVAMRNDLLQVQLRQNDVKSQRLKLQNGIFIVKQLLGQYANLTPTISSTGETQYLFEVQMPAICDNAPLPVKVGETEAVLRLPEYQLLEKQVEAATLQKKMEVGKNLPSVAVGAGYNYHDLLDNDRTFAMVFATVSIPISDWWGGSHAVKRKKIEQQRAVEELTDNSKLLKIRMQKAWHDVEEAREQLSLAVQSIEQAAENLRLNQNYYRAGTSRMSDLLEAQLLYQQACDKRTDAYCNYQNMLLEYRLATGRMLRE